MRRGIWHQCGNKSQNLALEQISLGNGVGAIFSPKDVRWQRVLDLAPQYADAGADLLIDTQFYNSAFVNNSFETYPFAGFRRGVHDLLSMTEAEWNELSLTILAVNEEMGSSAVIAPAVTYQAGRSDIFALNARFVEAAKLAADTLNRPVYATVILGNSITSTNELIESALGSITQLDVDGWYFGFEFNDERLPSDVDAILRCGAAGLILAGTGKPYMFAFAGPMALLSFGMGATGAGIGHAQKLWQFTSSHWEPPVPGGGNGGAPPRFFSTNLWGTIIYPDETAQLSIGLAADVLQIQTDFSASTLTGGGWTRWEACKHLLSSVGQASTAVASVSTNARENANAAIGVLDNAIYNLGRIRGEGLTLKDNSDGYQQNWRDAMSQLLANHSTEYDYLDLL